MQIEINSFDELISFLEEYDLKDEQVVEVITKALKIFVAPEDKPELLKKVRDYWKQYGTIKERPLFLDATE